MAIGMTTTHPAATVSIRVIDLALWSTPAVARAASGDNAQRWPRNHRVLLRVLPTSR